MHGDGESLCRQCHGTGEVPIYEERSYDDDV